MVITTEYTFILKRFDGCLSQYIYIYIIYYIIYIYIYEIVKTMCPPGYHHNGFVATHEPYIMCPSA